MSGLSGGGLQQLRTPGGAVRPGRHARRPVGIAPDVHIYTKSKLPWVTLPAAVPAVEVYYDRKALWPAASLERLDAIFAPTGSDG